MTVRMTTRYWDGRRGAPSPIWLLRCWRVGFFLLAMTSQTSFASEADKDTVKRILDGCVTHDTVRDVAGTLTVEWAQDANAVYRRRVYRRIWQQLPAAGAATKMNFLFVQEPASLHERSYLRWDRAGVIEDWVYLPALQKTRRATVRDSEDALFRQVEEILALGLPPLHGPFNIEWGDVSLGIPNSVGGRLEKAEGAAESWRIGLLLSEQGKCFVKNVQYLDGKGKPSRILTWSWRVDTAGYFRNLVQLQDTRDNQSLTFLLSDTQVNTSYPEDFFSPSQMRSASRSYTR